MFSRRSAIGVVPGMPPWEFPTARLSFTSVRGVCDSVSHQATLQAAGVVSANIVFALEHTKSRKRLIYSVGLVEEYSRRSIPDDGQKFGKHPLSAGPRRKSGVPHFTCVCSG